MDGRDIGTTVLPEAEVKIFLLPAPGLEQKDGFWTGRKRGLRPSRRLRKSKLISPSGTTLTPTVKFHL